MPRLSAVIASTSGHTEFVVDEVLRRFRAGLSGYEINVLRAETATKEDLLGCDVLLLASGTWNTGGVEGQLNPHMHELLFSRSLGIDLQGKPVMLVSLGDDRYYFTTRCTERFVTFLKSGNGKIFGMPLVILNEPYDQTEKIEKWADAQVKKLEVR